MKQKNGKIEMLRFLFSVIIMLFHSSNIEGFSDRLFKTGAFAVEFFFIVSGFLMVASVDKQMSTQRERLPLGRESFLFMKKKIVSIYPEVFVSWLTSVVVYVMATDKGAKETIDLFIKSLGDVLLIKSSGLSVSSINPVVWYISSMLIVMAVLYPLLRKYKDMMLHIVLPLGAVLAFGYLRQTAGTLRNPDQWLGLFTRGLPRAFAEIAIGAVCYPVCQKLMNTKLTTLGKFLCTAVEWSIYLLMLLFMHFGKSSARDYFYVFILAVAVMITFSGQTLDAKWYNNKLCYWLGKFSLSIYLSHAVWYKTVDCFVSTDVSAEKRFVIYIGLSMANAFLVYFAGVLWRKVSTPLREFFKRKLVAA